MSEGTVVRVPVSDATGEWCHPSPAHRHSKAAAGRHAASMIHGTTDTMHLLREDALIFFRAVVSVGIHTAISLL